MSKQPMIAVDALQPVGRGLHRPECVLAVPSGELFVPDWRGGVTRIAPDGSQQTWLARAPAIELRPNGIALTGDGSFLLANLADSGGVWRLGRDGELQPFLTEIDGVPLPPVNFVVEDSRQRTWISVSTRRVPRQQAWRPDVADGFVVVVDRHGARIAADGLHYTNEVRPDPSGTWLYVVETFGRRLIRFRIGADGSLTGREPFVALGHGFFPDGFAFDEAGGVWITSLVSNRLVRVHDGAVETILEDDNAEHTGRVEQAFAEGRMSAPDLGRIPGTMLQQLTSVAFGGADGRTVYLGSLHADCFYRFRAEVRGVVTVVRRLWSLVSVRSWVN